MSQLKQDSKESPPVNNDKELSLPEKRKVSALCSTGKSNKKAEVVGAKNGSSLSHRLNGKSKPNHRNVTTTIVGEACDSVQKETTEIPKQIDAKPTISSHRNQNLIKNEKMYRYEVDLTEMAELKTVNALNFKDYITNHFKDNGKVNDLSKNVTVEQDGWTVIVKSKVFFKKSVLKYHAKKFLKMKKLRDFVKVVGKGKLGYRFAYYQPQ